MFNKIYKFRFLAFFVPSVVFYLITSFILWEFPKLDVWNWTVEERVGFLMTGLICYILGMVLVIFIQIKNLERRK